MSNRNLSESLAQYSVKSFATYLAEADTGVLPANTNVYAGGGGNGKLTPVNDTAAQGPRVQSTGGGDINTDYPCIGSPEGCNQSDLDAFLENSWAQYGGEGLSQILGAWGDAGGGAQPIGPQIGAGGAPGAGGGGGPAIGKKDNRGLGMIRQSR